jgi:hypothetical protein
MFDAVVTALFRAVWDEASVDLPTHEARKNALVASKALESTPTGELNAGNFRGAGRKAHLPAPSMWN